MSVSLQKGQKISLTKGNEGLSKVIIGLGWDEAAKSKGGLFGSLFGSSGPAIDCDASAFVLQNGKLTDKFGDNGVITVVIGRQEGETVHIQLWLMSCRVLKRNMEHAMLDALAAQALARGARTLRGYYYKTAKNKMVEDFYAGFGFTLVERNGEDTVWELDLTGYQPQNHVIKVVD